MITVTTFYRQPEQTPSKLWPILKIIALALLTLALVASCGFVAWRSLMREKLLERATSFAQQRGLELHIGFIDALSLDQIDLQDVHLKTDSDAKLSAFFPKISVSPDLSAALAKKPLGRSLKMISLEKPIFHITSDGTPKGLYQALKSALPKTQKAAPTQDAKGPRILPPVQIHQGRIIDHGGFLQVQDLELFFARGEFRGSLQLNQPDMGPCTFSGDFDHLDLSCERAFSHPLPNDLLFSAGVIELQRKPELSLHIPAAHIRSQTPDHHSLLDNIAADIQVTLARRQGRWPIQVALVFPGGGRIEIAGEADESGLSLAFDVNNLDLTGLSSSMQGSFTGSLSVQADRETRSAQIKPNGRLHDLIIEHPALGDSPIGPFDLALKGDLSAEMPGAFGQFRIKIERGRLELGDVPFEGQLLFDNTGEHAQFQASASTPRVTGDALTAAIPKGLLPNLQPLHFKGVTEFSSKVDIDMGNLQATVLEAKVDLKHLFLETYNPAINFESLRSRFETHFEMPDETIIIREQGPDTDRWVPLSQVPELLPLAITAQEDGGFYSHDGVSMLHLRGSLIRNLERGRFVRGGSTLTMQVARNLFLNRHKTLGRKLEELIVAWQLEKEFNKDELIELYINIVEFGPEIFGIGDAAEHYFGRQPADLKPEQIAFLVRLLPSPRAFYEQFEKKKLTKQYKRYIERLLKLCQTKGYLDSNEVFEIDLAHFFDRPEPGSELLPNNAALKNDATNDATDSEGGAF